MFWNKPTDAMRRMLKAREGVARRNPFFASLLFMARLVESDKQQTIWSDGINIYFNPKYVLHPQADPFIEGDLLHNIMHCAMLHWPRRKWREQDRWNEACDYSINPVVEHYFKLGPWALRDPKYADKSPEAIYELLEQQPQKQKPQPQKGGGKGQGQGKPEEGDGEGEGDPNPNDPTSGEQPGGMHDAPSQEEADQAAQEWRRGVANAIDKSKQAGNMPGNIIRLVDQLFPAEKVDWKELLRDMSRDAKAKTTRTWSRPNRRRADYMPGYGTDQIFRLVICFDVSGSVDHNMHKAMRQEVMNLLDQNLINRVTVMAVDTAVHNETDVSNSEELAAWKPRGGGGTDFRTAMDRVGEMEDVVGCLFLTDMETSSFGKDPGIPTVWVDWNGGHHKAPYGRVVAYK